MLLRCFVRLLALISLLACSHVSPWQRERLASPKMQLGDDPEADLLEEHVFQYREGSVGGYGGGGGGCGCN